MLIISSNYSLQNKIKNYCVRHCGYVVIIVNFFKKSLHISNAINIMNVAGNKNLF